MNNSTKGKIYFSLSNQTSKHELCPFNPKCPPEIIQPLLLLYPSELQEAFRFILINHTNPEFSVTQIPEKFDGSLRTWERLFHEKVGCTLESCLAQVRLCHYLVREIEYGPLAIKKEFDKVGFGSRNSCNYERNKYLTSHNASFLALLSYFKIPLSSSVVRE